MTDSSDWIYAPHAARALAGQGRGADDLYIHFGHFDGAGIEGSSMEAAAGGRGLGALAPPSWNTFRAAQRALDDRMVGLARITDEMRVADVGCGVGGTLASLDAGFAGMDLHGINVDPRQIEAARARVEPRPGNHLAWHVADALALPLADASVERVLAIEAIPHFGSRARFLLE